MMTESDPGFSGGMAGDDPRIPKRDQEGFEAHPCCIYFYYVGPNPNQGPSDVREYYYADGVRPFRMRDEVETAIIALTKNARKPIDRQDPKPSGYNWEKMVWKRKSYLAILIDDPSFTFERKALIFDRKNGALPNHSFYDAWHKKLNIPLEDGGARRNCPVVVVINHMKDAVGQDLDDRSQDFHFDLYTQPPLDPVRAKHPDSGGTNMGPPVPPP